MSDIATALGLTLSEARTAQADLVAKGLIFETEPGCFRCTVFPLPDGSPLPDSLTDEEAEAAARYLEALIVSGALKRLADEQQAAWRSGRPDRRPQPDGLSAARYPVVGDRVRWGRSIEPWRVRGLVLAPAPSVTLGILGRRDSLRVEPTLWAKARWDHTRQCWRLPDPA